MQKARRHGAQGATPTACRHTVSGSVSLPCSGFFSPFPHGTGPLSVSQEYLALADGAAGFPQGVSDPAVLRNPLGWLCLRVRDCHPLWYRLPFRFPLRLSNAMLWSYNPGYALTCPVWAVPLSLATTCGITVVFSSYAYLDVSVQRVRVLYAYPSDRQVAPFGNHRIDSHLRIPGAYRSLSRPSSPLGA